MNNNFSSGSGNNTGSTGNPNAFVSRRNLQAGNTPPPAAGSARNYTTPGSFDFEQMISSMRELFEQDRQIASQSDSTRCGLCYLYFPVNDLHYRDEGFYVCQDCSRGLGKQELRMVRKQQKL